MFYVTLQYLCFVMYHPMLADATVGAMGPWIVAYLLATTSSLSTNLKWRLLLGLGCVPAFFVVGFSVWESYAHEQDTSPMEKALKDGSHSRHQTLGQLLKTSRVQKQMLATGGGWFLYDICYCKSGLGLG